MSSRLKMDVVDKTFEDLSQHLYKFKGDALEDLLKEIRDYIEATFGQHYVGSETGIQINDVFEELNIAPQFYQACAIKYISRFGRKRGYNKKDLLKAMHYVLLLLDITKRKGKLSYED